MVGSSPVSSNRGKRAPARVVWWMRPCKHGPRKVSWQSEGVGGFLWRGLARGCGKRSRTSAGKAGPSSSRSTPGTSSPRGSAGTTGTRIEQQTAALSEAAEIVNRSFPTVDTSGRFINAISPVVIPNRQSLFWRLMPIGMLAVFVFLGVVVTVALSQVSGAVGLVLFGPHLWLLLIGLAAFTWWRQSVVMVPDGCRAVITRFGKLEEAVGAGRKLLFNPWKQVSYIVNTAREYPYNAPIRQAPTSSRVNASVDLFLQFRIEDPAEFIFVARMLEEQETEAQRVRLESRDAWPRRPHRGGERGYGPPSPRPGPQDNRAV